MDKERQDVAAPYGGRGRTAIRDRSIVMAPLEGARRGLGARFGLSDDGHG